MRNLLRERVTVSNSGPGEPLLLGRLSELDHIDDGRVIVIVSTSSAPAVARDQEGEVIDEMPGWVFQGLRH